LADSGSIYGNVCCYNQIYDSRALFSIFLRAYYVFLLAACAPDVGAEAMAGVAARMSLEQL